MPIEFYQAC
jgi:hypothetical protein